MNGSNSLITMVFNSKGLRTPSLTRNICYGFSTVLGVHLCMITNEHLNKSLSYTKYRELLDQLQLEGKTTGHNQSAEYVEYGRVNIQRMKRLDKTLKLLPETEAFFSTFKKKIHIVVITEGWCGDTAQFLPLLHKLEIAFPHVDVRLVLRDENPEVMDQYLTNGSRSIPKLIALDEQLNELFTWGPRPAPLQKMVKEALANGISAADKGVLTQNWYNQDGSVTMQHELIALFQDKFKVDGINFRCTP